MSVLRHFHPLGRPASRHTAAAQLVHCVPNFESMPGTDRSDVAGDEDPFSQEPLADSAGG